MGIEGSGVWHYGNGMRYEGEFSNNLRHGSGTEYYTANAVRYHGQWSNGLYEGQGEYFDETSGFYAGSFRRGMFHGIGQVKINNQTQIGVWENNRYVGGDKALVNQISFNWLRDAAMSF